MPARNLLKIVIIVLTLGILIFLTLFLFNTPRFANSKSVIFYKNFVRISLDKYYEIQGEDDYFIAEDIWIESETDGIYTYSLAGRVVDVNLSDRRLIFQDVSGQIWKIFAEDIIREHEDGKVAFSLLEAEIGEDWGWAWYEVDPENSSKAREIFCTGELAFLVWSSSEELNYWQSIPERFGETYTSLGGPSLHIQRNYFPGHRMVDLVSIDKSTCF